MQILSLLLISMLSAQDTAEPASDLESDSAANAQENTQPTASTIMSRPNSYPAYTSVAPVDSDTEFFFGDWPWGSDGITGDWGGVRTDLIDKGIYLNGEYTSLLLDNFTGGAEQAFYGAGIAQLALTIDTERLAGLEGGTFFLAYGYANWYNRMFESTGTFSPTGSGVGSDVNFLYSDQSTLNQINQLFWRQELFDDKLQITFGKIDANVEFGNLAAVDSFQYVSSAAPPSMLMFLPTYPNASTGLEIALQLNDQLTGKFGWWDGTTYALDPKTGEVGPRTGDRGPKSFFNNDGHWFLVTEWDYSWQLDQLRPGSLAAGAWLQTGRSTTAGNSTTGVNDVPGFYIGGQQTIWAPSGTIAQDGGGITAFAQVGWSPPSKNPYEFSIIGGFSATGVIPGRPADALGIMGSGTFFSDNAAIYQSITGNGQPGPPGGNEAALEVYYKVQLAPAFSIQPGIEWITTPSGGDPAPLDDAVVGYLIVNVQF